MGKWKNMTGVKVDALQDAIFKIMEEYGDIIFQAANEGVEEAAKELAKDMKAASPKSVGKTHGHPSGTFAKGWKVEAKKYKMVRFVGNKTTVPSKKYGDISLANILEYSTTRGKPFMKKTMDANADKLARIIMGRIEKDA